MVMNVLEEQKIIQIWLTNEEKDDPDVHARLKPVFTENNQRGFQTVVYKSGKQDLKEGIRDLLLYNKRKLAELELQQEKQQKGMAVS